MARDTAIEAFSASAVYLSPPRKGVLLIDHDDAGGDEGTTEEIRRQADDPSDVDLPDEVAADLDHGVAAEVDPMCRMHPSVQGQRTLKY